MALAVLALLVGFFVPAAYYRLFSTFNWWDDEGYVMIGVANNARGQPLYDSVSSLYGPFYFLASWVALHVPGVQLDHATVRFIVEVLWLASALLGAGFIYRCTRNVSATAFTFVFLALHLQSLASEPGHPQGLVILLLFAAVFLCVFQGGSSARRLAPCLGVIAAALFLTKINVGVFFIASIGLAVLAFTHLAGRARFVELVAWVVALLLPVALMRDHLADGASPYCIMVVATTACVGGVLLASKRDALFRPRALLVFAVAFVVAGCFISAFALLRGTSLRGLLDGVILQHLDAARIYYTAVEIRDVDLVWSAAAVALAVLHLVLLRIGTRAARADGVLLMALRIVFGWAVIDGILAVDSGKTLIRAAPFLWVSLVAPASRGELAARIEPSRAFLAVIAMLQSLQAYPVAGTQTTCSSMLLVPAAAVSLADALSILARPLGRALPKLWWTAIRWTTAAVCVFVAIAMCRHERDEIHAIFERNARLGLPGTGELRLGEKECAIYRWLASNLQGQTFYTLPGLNSLYFWTGKNSPTMWNFSFGWFFLSPLQQGELIDHLERLPQLMIVYADRNDYYPLVQDDGKQWPLLKYIRQRFTPAARVDIYELRVRRGKTLATTYRARLEDGAISLEIPPFAGQELHGIILAPANSQPYFGNIYYLTEPLRQLVGKPELSADQRLSAPIDLTRPTRVAFPCTSEDAKNIRGARFPVARLYDAHGNVIASLPFER